MAKLMIYDDNTDGNYFVHDACIACDTCTQIAPEHFKLTADYDHAVVTKQPCSKVQIDICNEAIDACPVAAIGKHDDT